MDATCICPTHTKESRRSAWAIRCWDIKDSGPSTGDTRSGGLPLLCCDKLFEDVPEMRERRIRPDSQHLEVGIGFERALLLLDDRLVLHETLDETVEE